MEYIAGAAVMFVVGIIAAGVVFGLQADEIRKWKAHCFALVEQVTDLEARKHPFNYVTRTDGVYTMIERGRPDSPPSRQPVEPTGKVLVMPEIDDLPKWGDGDG